jgi:hypothetical protein
MSESRHDDERDDAAEQAAERAERATQERDEMRRKATLADDADSAGEGDQLERESEAHRQAAYEQEGAASDRANDETP